MDILSPFLHLAVKSLVILFPLTVSWLAFRRLALSKSTNAWIYASICLFAVTAAAGVLPWSLGLSDLNIPLLLMALAAPTLWVATLFICDLSRVSRYGPDPLFATARSVAEKAAPNLTPLLLGEDMRTAKEAPVFRHQPKPVPVLSELPERSAATKTLLALARDIRGNTSSERRRPKLLPAPETRELPFVPTGGKA